MFNSNEDLTNGKSCDIVDEINSQFDFEQNGTNKLKPMKKPADKFFINETIYELDDSEDLDDDDFIMSDEADSRKYKCSSPNKRQCSVRSPELDFEFDDCDITSNMNSTMPVDMPSAQRPMRTYSSSSEADELVYKV